MSVESGEWREKEKGETRREVEDEKEEENEILMRVSSMNLSDLDLVFYCFFVIVRWGRGGGSCELSCTLLFLLLTT